MGLADGLRNDKMTQLTKLFSNLSFAEPALWVALGSGIAVVMVFLFLGRRHRRPLVVGPAGGNEATGHDAWLPAMKSADERRRSIRRTGVPTAVSLTDPKKPKRPADAFVLDRSSGGLRLATEKPFPSGSSLQVRPVNAPPDLQSIAIIVRSCREVGDHFELGCQFMEELEWNILLMFG